jgi:hypothetical protein
MGTKSAVYKYEQDSKRLTPKAIPRDPEIVNDVAPAERWQFELMGHEGEETFKKIVTEVKSMSVILTNVSVNPQSSI